MKKKSTSVGVSASSREAKKEDGNPALVPKLRFPHFRGERTTLKAIGEFAKVTTGNKDTQNKVDGGKYPFFVRSQNVERINSFSHDGQAVLTSGDGVGVGENYHDITGKFDFHQRVYRIFDFHDNANGQFFFQYFSTHFKKRVKAMSAKNSVDSVRMSMITEMPIWFPSLAEQQKIAECLSSVDELMAAQGRKVDPLKTHKKGLMQQLFPREGETQPRLRFPEFQNAGEWVTDSLGNIFETTSGGTPSRTKKSYWNGDIPWITTSLVDFRVITSAEEFITAEGLKNSSAKLFPKGTVLMALYGQGKTRGQVAILDIQAATNQACAAILPRNDIDPYFVFLNLAGRYEEIRDMSNSGGQENLSQGLIREIPFAFPQDRGEQRKVTSCLRSLDALITAETQKLEALKTHKRGLMQQLFPSPEERA